MARGGDKVNQGRLSGQSVTLCTCDLHSDRDETERKCQRREPLLLALGGGEVKKEIGGLDGGGGTLLRVWG